MNNQGRPPFLPFHLVQRIAINVHIDRKVFYQQRIVFMFGPERLREILESPLHFRSLLGCRCTILTGHSCVQVLV